MQKKYTDDKTIKHINNEKMKNILFVHDFLGFDGGLEQNIFSVAKPLSQFFELSYLFREKTGVRVDEFSSSFSNLYQIDYKEDSLLSGEKVSALLSQKKPDLIYIQKCLNENVLKALIESGIPTVHMVHDHEVYCLRGSKYFPISRTVCTKKAGMCCLFPGLAFLKKNKDDQFEFEWKSCSKRDRLVALDQQCDAFFVPTQYMKETLVVQGYDADKIFIEFASSPRKDIIEPTYSSNNNILFIGQIIRGKGLDLLIESLQFLTVPFHLHVLGRGKFQFYCESLVKRLNLSNKVTFHGFVSSDQMELFYKDATVGVVPSVWAEPIATVGLEMLWHRLPVVGFNCGGIESWLKDGLNGYLVHSKDVKTMGEKINDLLANKEMAKKMGEFGFNFVKSHYDFDDYIARVVERFELLIGKSEKKCKVDHLIDSETEKSTLSQCQ